MSYWQTALRDNIARAQGKSAIGVQRSIHPNGRPCANTSKPRRKRVVTDAMQRHADQHPRDAMTGARISKIQSGKA